MRKLGQKAGDRVLEGQYIGNPLGLRGRALEGVERRSTATLVL